MPSKASKPTREHPPGFRLNLLAFTVLLVVAAFAVVSQADGRNPTSTFVPASAHAETIALNRENVSVSSRPVGLVICRVFGPKCAKAVEVAYCESGMRADAVSRTRDVGVFQVNYATHRKRGESFAAFKRRMSDVDRNVAFAYRLSKGGRDWGAWSSSKECWS